MSHIAELDVVPVPRDGPVKSTVLLLSGAFPWRYIVLPGCKLEVLDG